MAIESINPANNKLLRRFEPLTDEAARQKIALASDAFRSYANVPLEHRALWMRKLASILEQEAEDLATLITLEMGKPLDAARFEIHKCADYMPLLRRQRRPYARAGIHSDRARTTAMCAGIHSASCSP